MEKNERTPNKNIWTGHKGTLLSFASILVNIIVFIYSLNNMLTFQLIGISPFSQQGVYMITSYVLFESLIATLIFIPPIFILRNKRSNPKVISAGLIVALIITIVGFDGYFPFLIPLVLDFLLLPFIENSLSTGNTK